MDKKAHSVLALSDKRNCSDWLGLPLDEFQRSTYFFTSDYIVKKNISHDGTVLKFYTHCTV